METSSFVPAEACRLRGRRYGRPFEMVAENRLQARLLSADVILSRDWVPERLIGADGSVLLEGAAFRQFSEALLFGRGYVFVEGKWLSCRRQR
jgi:hypothetical protein